MVLVRKSQTVGDASQSAPPAYGDVHTKEADKKEVDMGIVTAHLQKLQIDPGIAGNGKFYSDIPMTAPVWFWVVPEPKRDLELQQWCGRIYVKCDDVPRLMREGFHWTTANLIREEGHFDTTPFGVAFPLTLCHKYPIWRKWYMRDLQQPPRWVACVHVHAPTVDVAAKVRLADWTVDMIWGAYAIGTLGKRIYNFERARPGHSYNAIYEDMPLEGWWPWPKKEADQEKEGDPDDSAQRTVFANENTLIDRQLPSNHLIIHKFIEHIFRELEKMGE
ncbi:hypothetical protein F5Y02DRAFT_431380 [Annulohypoxylon stygium]|nr:hypothetical protein F5Y02DRAFT_431380 [Annulohypoxylon stygium]